MAEFIAESPRLLRLDLRENEIKTGGLMALSLALKVNTSLLRLDLDREPKKETVSMGGKMVQKCPHVSFLNRFYLVASNRDKIV